MTLVLALGSVGLGEVVPDPEAEERILQQLLELREAFTARHQAPHRRRMRMQ